MGTFKPLTEADVRRIFHEELTSIIRDCILKDMTWQRYLEVCYSKVNFPEPLEAAAVEVKKTGVLKPLHRWRKEERKTKV